MSRQQKWLDIDTIVPHCAEKCLENLQSKERIGYYITKARMEILKHFHLERVIKYAKDKGWLDPHDEYQLRQLVNHPEYACYERTYPPKDEDGCDIPETDEERAERIHEAVERFNEHTMLAYQRAMLINRKRKEKLTDKASASVCEPVADCKE